MRKIKYIGYFSFLLCFLLLNIATAMATTITETSPGNYTIKGLVDNSSRVVINATYSYVSSTGGHYVDACPKCSSGNRPYSACLEYSQCYSFSAETVLANGIYLSFPQIGQQIKPNGTETHNHHCWGNTIVFATTVCNSCGNYRYESNYYNYNAPKQDYVTDHIIQKWTTLAIKTLTLKNCVSPVCPLRSSVPVDIDGGTYAGYPGINSVLITVHKGTITDYDGSRSIYMLGEDSEQTIVKDGTTTITTVKLSNPPSLVLPLFFVV